MAAQTKAGDLIVKTTYMPGRIEHNECVQELIRNCNSLGANNNGTFIINAGYGMAVVLGETKIFKNENGNMAVFNVFLKDSLAKKDWRISTDRPVSLVKWRLIHNAMRNLATHQEVDPEEWTRRYDVLTTGGNKGNGTATKKKVTINFWYSLAIKSLKKLVMKGEEYLEVTIDMGLHKKLTTGWQPTQKPRYAVFDVGVRVVGDVDARNEGLFDDDPLEVRQEIEIDPSDDEECDHRGTKVGPRQVDLIAGIEYKPSPPRQISGVLHTKDGLDLSGGLYKSLFTKNPPTGISRASSSTPNNGTSDNETSINNNDSTPDGKQADNTLTQEDSGLPDASPNYPPKAPRILVDTTQSQVEQQATQGTQDKTKVIDETSDQDLERRSLRELYAKAVAKDWNNRCVVCQEEFHQTGTTKGKKTTIWHCDDCHRDYDTHPSSRCTLDHAKDCPPHCRAHHHYHMLGKLFEEADRCDLCSKNAWKASKDLSIFENDPYNYEPIGGEDSERDENDSDDDSENHEISPITEDLVSSITVGVNALKKRSKRSQAEIVDMKEMTMVIMSKVSRMEDSVANIRVNTTRTWETVGKIDQKIEQNKDKNLIEKLLLIKGNANGPVEGTKESTTTAQNGEAHDAEEEGKKQRDDTTLGKQMKEENKK